MNSRLNEILEEIRALEHKVQSEMAHIATLAGFRYKHRIVGLIRTPFSIHVIY